MITTLPDDVLCLVLQHIDFQGKCHMQLVCKRFNTVLSSPPPGLWGKLDLETDIDNTKKEDRISRQVPQSSTQLRMPQPFGMPMACPGHMRSAVQVQMAHQEATRLCKHHVQYLLGQYP